MPRQIGSIKAKLHPELWARWDPKAKTVWLYDTIRSPGIQEAVEGLAGLQKGDTVRVRINSYGGDAFAGLALHTALATSPARVLVQIDGAAASAAALVALAGDHITISPHGILFVHRAWTTAVGNARTLRATANELDYVDRQIAQIIQQRTGAAPDQVEQWLDGEDDGTMFGAEEALQVKLVDEILKAAEKPEAEPAEEAEAEETADLAKSPQNYVPDNPPGGDGQGVEGEWEKPRLQDFTDSSWDELSTAERRRIASYFGFALSLDTFGDLKLPHHFPPNHPKRNKASLAGVRDALARLSQTDGLSAEDRERVRAHLRAHLPAEDLLKEVVLVGLSRFAQGGAHVAGSDQ